MIQAAKILGTGLATTGLIGAGVGIGVVFGCLILGVYRNPSIRTYVFPVLIVSAYLLASLLFSIGHDLLYNGGIFELCNTFSGAYGDNVLFLEIGPDQDPDNISTLPMPGVKCPTCAARGIEQWVLPGKHCPRCSTAC